MMDLKDFLSEFRTLGFRRRTLPPVCGVVRYIRNEDGLCPLCALVKKKTGETMSNFNWDRAAARLGLEEEVARKIVRAADGLANMDEKEKTLREELLEACL